MPGPGGVQGFLRGGTAIFRETHASAELERPELDRLMAVARTSVLAAVFV